MGPFSSASTSYPSCLTSGIGAFIPSKIVERVTSQLRMWTLSPRVPGVCPRGSRTSYTRVVNLVWDAQSLPLSLQTASRQAYGAGNAVDFIHYPEGKTSSDVVDVLPHEGRTAEPVSSRILLVNSLLEKSIVSWRKRRDFTSGPVHASNEFWTDPAGTSSHPDTYLKSGETVMAAFFLWCILFVLCWPLALLALVLYPIVWLLLLPFRILGIAVHGVLALVWAVVMLPVRLLSAPF